MVTRSLRQSGCIRGRLTDRRIELTDPQIDSVATFLVGLRTPCATTCGSSDIQGELSFADCNGNPLGSFVGNVESPCGLPPPQPWMDANDIFSLRQHLGSIVSLACTPSSDAGNAGVCATRCRELSP
jgi:hypothetical protein